MVIKTTRLLFLTLPHSIINMCLELLHNSESKGIARLVVYFIFRRVPFAVLYVVRMLAI
jgi:hypothetical protein